MEEYMNVKKQMRSDKSETTLNSGVFALSSLFAALFYETNPIPIKEALGMMGKIDPELRLPLCSMGADNRNQLARVMKELRLI